MKRWHAEFPRIYREWRKHYLRHVKMNIFSGGEVGKDSYQVDCVCERQIGRFRKMDAGDCGIPRCQICHSDKYPVRIPTHQEWCAKLKLQEGIVEILRDGA